MTTSPVLALRKAIRDAIAANAALSGRISNQPVHDEAPRGANAPYITFGDVMVRDWSTSTDKGAEQFVTLHVWSTQPGVSEAVSIAGDVTRLLDDAALSLASHHLVNLKLVSIESRRENSGRFGRASLRFRAITESID